MNDYCFGCMKPIEKGIEVCPHCGYVQSTPPGEVCHFTPGTILHARYYVGQVVRLSAVCATYIGRDLKLDNIVTVSEYLPAMYAARAQGQQMLSVRMGEEFEAGLKTFCDGARRLAKFRDVQGAVEMLDFFFENNTAYIVAEYLEGLRLSSYLRRIGGRMEYGDAVKVLDRVMRATETIHAKGILHLDIRPDIIFLTADGRAKFIEFEGARLSHGENETFSGSWFNIGYAPPEQYMTRAKTGEYTDIYALGALAYRVLTGERPEESIDRQQKDSLKRPSELGVEIPLNAEKAIMKAMALKPRLRFRHVREMRRAFDGKETKSSFWHGQRHHVGDGFKKVEADAGRSDGRASVSERTD